MHIERERGDLAIGAISVRIEPFAGLGIRETVDIEQRQVFFEAAPAQRAAQRPAVLEGMFEFGERGGGLAFPEGPVRRRGHRARPVRGRAVGEEQRERAPGVGLWAVVLVVDAERRAWCSPRDPRRRSRTEPSFPCCRSSGRTRCPGTRRRIVRARCRRWSEAWRRPHRRGSRSRNPP